MGSRRREHEEVGVGEPDRDRLPIACRQEHRSTAVRNSFDVAEPRVAKEPVLEDTIGTIHAVGGATCNVTSTCHRYAS